MKKIKVMTVIGTRPEIIRLSRVMAELDRYCDHKIVHTGQNYDFELNQIFFDDLQIRRPDFFLDAAGETSAETIGNVIKYVDVIFEQEDPDAVLVLGDTNSSLSVIPAKRRKIPVFHMEAGNRCFDMRVPEEINRRIVDHTADVNLTYSDIARDCLLAEGLPSDFVIKTGSPMKEILSFYWPNVEKSIVLSDLNLKPYEYFVVSVHREENVDNQDSLKRLSQVLNALAEEFGLRIIVSTHPRTKKSIASKNLVFHSLVELLKPLGFSDYVKLQINAKAVLSDSGTISEEASILGFPALNLREMQERHEAFEEAAVMMVGLNRERVFQGLSILEYQGREEMSVLRLVTDYDIDNVSKKIVRIMHSYIDFVNRKIWSKKLH